MSGFPSLCAATFAGLSSLRFHPMLNSMIRRMTRATRVDGAIPLQNLSYTHSNVRMMLAAVGICALALSGCNTTKKVSDTSAPAAGANGLPARSNMLAKDSMLPKDSVLPKGSVVAKNGTTPSSLHVDPVASRDSARQAAVRPGVQTLSPEQAAALVGTLAPTPTPASSFPPAPAAPTQQASIAGLATQPTGIRADAGTIFSATPPAPPVATNANGPVPADLPRRNFNAMTASVFSAPQPSPAAACGTDAQGNPLSC